MSNSKSLMNEPTYRSSFFQKGEVKEQHIKMAMKPQDSFNPARIDDYINPQKSKEEQINDKVKAGKKLTSAEKIQNENFQKKRKEVLASDMHKIERIKENGSGDYPETEEGKILLLMYYLNKSIDSNNVTSICNIYLKIQKEGYVLSPTIIKDYGTILNKMEEVVNNSDLIKLQFTKFPDSMPPLNVTGFKKFDPWQLNVVDNVNKGISTIVSAPTSAGKTVLAGYATTKGRTLIVMPTDALCWQMSSYIGGFLNKDIPILTDTFNSITKDSCPCVDKKNSSIGLSCVLCSQSTREKIIKNLNNAVAIVGTPDAILNFLPFINTDFTWIIMDEIHMIGKIEGSSMEVIAKVFNSTNFLALSATIGNLTEVTSWFQKLNPKRSVQNIVCDKRFFNLQKYYYNSKENQLNILHPLALVNVDDFATKNLSATPTDTWLLYSKLKEEFGDLGNLNHDKYFGIREIIHLDRVNKYFMELIQYMSTKDKVIISKIIDSFKKVDLSDEPVDLVKLAFTLKESNKVPAIVFQKNTLACIKMIMDFGNKIEDLENAEFPDLYNARVLDREKGEKISISIAKLEKKILSEQKQSKKNRDKGKMIGRNMNNKNDENNKNDAEQDDDDEDTEGTEEEETEETEDPIQVLHNKLNLLDLANPYEPHYKYIFNPIQIFNEEKITDIINELKIWFPNEKGGRPHIIIRLLWRGIGIYAKGLPDPYLRLVQKLTCEKNIAILFSDMSLVFGVSMPFRTAVIYNDPYVVDDLDSMLYHQMAGRAGRRGLDKEGNVIFAGYKWSRIEELSTCAIPNIKGINTINYTVPHANMISVLLNKKLNWETIFDNPLSENRSECLTLNELNSNYGNKWSFALKKDINHSWMLWTLRNADMYEPLIISYLLPLIIKKFENGDYTDTNNQNNLFYLLANFLDSIIDEKDIEMQKIREEFKSLDIPTQVKTDDKAWVSFRMNKVIDTTTDFESNEIRKRLLILSQKMSAIQMYFYHINSVNITKLFGKIIKRLSNIYHNNSYLIKKIINKTEYQSVISVEEKNQPSFAYYYDEKCVVDKFRPSLNTNEDE
jgi:hypothetical protein